VGAAEERTNKSMLWHNSWAKSALFKGFCTIINHCYYCYLGLTATRFSNDFAGSLVDSVHGGEMENTRAKYTLSFRFS